VRDKSMIEYSLDVTVNYNDGEKDIPARDWYPMLDACLVQLKRIIEDEPKATSFCIAVVQRDHKP